MNYILILFITLSMTQASSLSDLGIVYSVSPKSKLKIHEQMVNVGHATVVEMGAYALTDLKGEKVDIIISIINKNKKIKHLSINQLFSNDRDAITFISKIKRKDIVVYTDAYGGIYDLSKEKARLEVSEWVRKLNQKK